MTADRPVLVVTQADDVTSDMVIGELNERGRVPVVRLDPAELGDALVFSARFGAGTGAGAPLGQVRTTSRLAALETVRAVYWRRPSWPDFAHLAKADARFSAAQVRHGLGGTLYALREALYVNHPLSMQTAEHKVLQLAAAERFGLAIPPTLVSNDLGDIRGFIAAHGRVVYKTLRWTPYSRAGQGMSTWTEAVTAEELDESVAVAPHLFQARVEKVADVRVVVIGDHVFAVRIDSDLLDWRADYGALTYKVIDLDGRLENALRAFLDHFSLVSGSFDLALREDGQVCLFELNANGNWGWLQDATGAPMSSAFADVLERGAS
ncbi:ATP-grasp ribosomal peptide maturase [Streptomyces aculeolatus]